MTTTAVPTWAPPSRRNQVAGAIGILLVVAFWVLLVPFVNGRVEGSNPFKPGVPYDVGGATIVPVDGWSLDAADAGLFTTMTKGSTRLTVTQAIEAASTVGDVLEATASQLRSDTSEAWQIGEPESFTTDDGTPAGRLVAISPAHADVTYVVGDGTRYLSIVTRTDPAAWQAQENEIDRMVRSVVLAAPSPSAGTVTP